MRMLCLFVAMSVLVSLFWIHPVAAAINAKIQNDSSYLDSAGYYHVVGEVKNTGDVWVQLIRVSATLKDQNGAIVDIPTGLPGLLHLPPNVAAGFDIVELNANKSSMVRSYSLGLAVEESPPRPVSLQVSNVTASRDAPLGWFEVYGQLENLGDSISENTLVTGTFYGVDGKVVYVSLTAPNQSTIQPNGHTTFAVTVLSAERSALVKSYSVAAESHQYISVPELPSQIAIVMGMSLASSIIAVRGRTKLCGG